MKQIRTHFLEDGIGDLIMRTNNNAEMDVIEQIEDAMAVVCDKICKHYEAYQKEFDRIKGLTSWGYEDAADILRLQQGLQEHCEECPLGRISHEFVCRNNA